MGVLACARNECTNTMCERYSDRYGYICDSCLIELCDLDAMIDDPVDVEWFMTTKPGDAKAPEWGYSKYYFDRVFPVQ